MKKLLILPSLIFVISVIGLAQAQDRKTVSAAEVNGTYQMYFSGKFKGSSNEIKILVFGKGKLRVSFELVYPFIDGTGEESANLGTADGMATINGDTAIYSSSEFGECRIQIKFVKFGTIGVTQDDTNSNCGFGHNVTANGTYKKSSGAKPKFEQ